MNMTCLTSWIYCSLVLFGLTYQVVGQDLPWPRKTGPFATGVAASVHSQGVPTKWDESQGLNIAWGIDLEGVGHSTPVIGNGRIWFTSATEDGHQQFVYCVSEDDGSVVHHELLFENEDPEPLNNPVNSYASPTCFLTSNAVYVHFGSYGTARLDVSSANVVWQRRGVLPSVFIPQSQGLIIRSGCDCISVRTEGDTRDPIRMSG